MCYIDIYIPRRYVSQCFPVRFFFPSQVCIASYLRADILLCWDKRSSHFVSTFKFFYGHSFVSISLSCLLVYFGLFISRISRCLFIFQFVILYSVFILFQLNHSLAHLFWVIRYLRISPFSFSLNVGSAFKLWHFIFVLVVAAASAGHIYSKNCEEVYVSDRVGFGHMFSQDRRVDDRSGSGTSRLELKQNLKTSRKGYKGHATKIRNEIEALMVSREYECSWQVS